MAPLAGLALAMLSFALAPASATAAGAWQDGLIKQTWITNCASIIIGTPRDEIGTHSQVGYFADPNNLPRAGEVFYGHTIVSVFGNSCAGHKVRIEVTPPPDTQLALSAENPIACFLYKFSDPSAQPTRLTPPRCPAQVKPGLRGSWYFESGLADDGTWPLAQGWWVEIMFPLKANRALGGTARNPCDCIWGWNWVLDGHSSPWVHPEAPVWATAAPTQPTQPTSPTPQPTPTDGSGSDKATSAACLDATTALQKVRQRFAAAKSGHKAAKKALRKAKRSGKRRAIRRAKRDLGRAKTKLQRAASRRKAAAEQVARAC